jgi:hypothetical protein
LDTHQIHYVRGLQCQLRPVIIHSTQKHMFSTIPKYVLVPVPTVTKVTSGPQATVTYSTIRHQYSTDTINTPPIQHQYFINNDYIQIWRWLTIKIICILFSLWVLIGCSLLYIYWLPLPTSDIPNILYIFLLLDESLAACMLTIHFIDKSKEKNIELFLLILAMYVLH